MEEELKVMIPIIAIIMGIGMGIGVAAWAIYWDYQKKRLQYEERRLMIEKGMTPPPDLAAEKKLVTPEDCLRRGTILLFLGIGLGIASLVVPGPFSDFPPVWLLGVAAAIVGLLGLGNLVYYFIARNREPHATGSGS